jgi:hypothetical protein
MMKKEQSRDGRRINRQGIARSVDDSNVVILVFAISDIDKAKAMINSEEQKN